jgi:hypothetical protein
MPGDRQDPLRTIRSYQTSELPEIVRVTDTPIPGMFGPPPFARIPTREEKAAPVAKAAPWVLTLWTQRA